MCIPVCVYTYVCMYVYIYIYNVYLDDIQHGVEAVVVAAEAGRAHGWGHRAPG